MSRIHFLQALIIVVLLIVSILPVGMTQASQPSYGYQAMVDPRLLLDETYNVESLLASRALGVDLARIADERVEGVKLREGQVIVSIVASKSLSPELLESKTHGVFFGFDLGYYMLYKAWATQDDVEELARTPGVYSISLFTPPLDNLLFMKGKFESLDVSLDEGIQPTLYKAVDVLGASRVWEEYGITGKGVVVGVVDSGVDFGISDLGVDAIARDENGLPLTLDSDLIGLTLTLSQAVKGDDGFINVSLPVVYFDGFFLEIGETNASWLLYVAPSGSVAYFEVPVDRYYVGDIESGAPFKFGLAVETQLLLYGSLGILQYALPVLLTDSNMDGSYDTVYADLSSMYYLFLLALNQTGMMNVSPDPALLDLSFADEAPVTYGSEVVARDFTGDGINDFSAGALAGYIYDYLGIFTGNEITPMGWDGAFDYAGMILPGLDTQTGSYVAFVYDFIAHGTSVANVIAGRGVTTVDLGYGSFKLKGIAPEAKLGANTGLINPFVSQLFFSGLDVTGFPWKWEYTGRHKVDIISNSWGNSYIGLIGFMSTFDPYSLIEDFIVANTGTIVVHAMGNGGPGYGTATLPGAASMVISVGASTLFDYRPFYNYLPGAWGEVVSWSDRGPTDAGLAKPDVVNIGSFAWSMTPVLTGLGDGSQAVDLFGGTSEATPMTSGVVALLLQAYRETYGSDPAPGLIKAVLKSTAQDLGYDPYVQGSGHVDAYTAVKAIIEGGIPIAYSTTAYDNLYSLMGENNRFTPTGDSVSSIIDTQLYTGVMKPGESKTLTLTLQTLSGSASASLEAVTFKQETEGLLKYLDLNNAYLVVGSTLTPLSDLIVNVNEEENTIYLNLTGVVSGRILIPMKQEVLQGDGLVEIVATYPYSVQDPFGRRGSYGFLFYSGFELQYGVDVDGNGVYTPNETARMNYDIRLANTFHITVGNPEQKVNLVKQAIEDYLNTSINGLPQAPILDFRILINIYTLAGLDLVVPLKLELRRTTETSWTWITLPSSTTVSNTPSTVNVQVSVPGDARPGLYQGYVKVTAGGQTVLIPVSIPVAATLTEDSKQLLLESDMEDTPYKNYMVEGKADWTWRYESGDWRTIPLLIEDDTVVGLMVTVKWDSPDTSIDAMMAGYGVPVLAGEPIDTFYGAVIAGKLTLPLYTGGWFPHYDNPAPTYTTMLVPIQSTDKPFWLVIHNTLLRGGDMYPEEFKVVVKPIRAYYTSTLSLNPGETGSVDVRVTGSFAISGAYVNPVLVEGNATVTASTPRLGFGPDQTFTLQVTPQTDSKIAVLLVMPNMNTYSIGVNMMGAKTPVLETPGVIPLFLTVTTS
ncbi:MAG: S8 family serine peptidase [Desulfurococcales archaeon]|nr:S8 family serine peptidase [Desulfurococcales archaeon]